MCEKKNTAYSGSNGEGGPRNGGRGLRRIAQTPRPAFCLVFSFVSFETHESGFSVLLPKMRDESHP